MKNLIRPFRYVAAAALAVAGLAAWVQAAGEPGQVVVLQLSDIVQPISAQYVVRGIAEANRRGASAILLELDTPGGLEDSMREIVQAIFASHAPVITYVAPGGARAASAGLFILVAGDLAIMAPGTNTGAAHPVTLGGAQPGKVMETKIENDAAAYIRSIASKRGRNASMAEEAVRQSKSYTEKEALDGHLIDAIESSPEAILKQYDGKTITRYDGSTLTLHLADARLVGLPMTPRERFLSRLADPNIAFLLGALGVLCLYLEFTHPGLVAPGVVGAVSLVLALFGFHLLPLNYAGVLLILVSLVLFALEAKTASHGVLAAGGVVSMVVGSLILIDTPLPGARIHLLTSLSVTLPLAAITIVLLRAAIRAKKQKAVTGSSGLVDAVGIARTDLSPAGQVTVHGELWQARATARVVRGSQVRVVAVDGLTVVVEPLDGTH